MCPLSVVAAPGRGPAVRARYRYLPRDGTVLVEPVRPDVRRGDPETARSKPFVFSLALAPGRGLCEINGETHYLWRAVDHEGEVLESFVTKRRDRRAALAFLKKAMKRYGPPKVIVTDRLRSYRAAMVQLGNARRQEIGRWLNNRGENSHLPFRRREYSMQRFRQEETLQKFVSVHSAVCNHFNHERRLISREDFKAKREAALVEWQQLSNA